jgi:hypothetical protein
VARLFGSIRSGVSGRGFFNLGMTQLSRWVRFTNDVDAGPVRAVFLLSGWEALHRAPACDVTVYNGAKATVRHVSTLIADAPASRARRRL